MHTLTGNDAPTLILSVRQHLASLALQLTPRPDLAAPLADQMPQHSVRLAALAATLTSQQVTQYRADAIGGEPDAASRVAASLNNLVLTA
jgi:hypothetical protein